MADTQQADNGELTLSRVSERLCKQRSAAICAPESSLNVPGSTAHQDPARDDFLVVLKGARIGDQCHVSFACTKGLLPVCVSIFSFNRSAEFNT